MASLIVAGQGDYSTATGTPQTTNFRLSGCLAGDRVLCWVGGKYDTTTIPTVSHEAAFTNTAGGTWTFVESFTGGTGAAGADTGTVFLALYAYECISPGTVKAPEFTTGAVVPNSWNWTAEHWRPATGKAFVDPIADLAAWTNFASDTNTASPLEGTVTFPDYSMPGVVSSAGVCPTDSGTLIQGSGFYNLTLPGWSGGTNPGRQGNPLSDVNPMGNDLTLFFNNWTGWTSSSPTGPLTISISQSGGTNHSGVVGAVFMRESKIVRSTAEVQLYSDVVAANGAVLSAPIEFAVPGWITLGEGPTPGSGGPVDLSTFVNISNTQYVGGNLVPIGAGPMKFLIPGVPVIPGEDYPAEIDATGVSGFISAYGQSDETAGSFTEAPGDLLGGDDDSGMFFDAVAGDGTYTMTIGPGYNNYGDIVPLGKVYVAYVVNGTTQVITEIRMPVEPPVAGAGVIVPIVNDSITTNQAYVWVENYVITEWLTTRVLATPIASNTFDTEKVLTTTALVTPAAENQLVRLISNDVWSTGVPVLSWPYGNRDIVFDPVVGANQDVHWFQIPVGELTGNWRMWLGSDLIPISIYEDDGTTLLHTFPADGVMDVTSLADQTLAIKVDQSALGVNKLATTTMYWNLISAPYYDVRSTPVVLPSVLRYATNEYTLVGLTDEGSPTPPTGSTGTGWFAWTAPADTVVYFSVVADSPITATLYKNGSVVGGDLSGTAISFPAISVVTGDDLEFRVATLTGGGNAAISWSADTQDLEPAPLSPQLRVEVYDRSGLNKITELPRRYAPRCQDVLNAVGVGEVSILADDILLAAYPTLLQNRNVVKFWLGSKCIFAFRIRERKSSWVTNDEFTGRVRTVSGPEVKDMMNEFTVQFDLPAGPREDSKPVRHYDWTAKENNSTSGVGGTGWYNPADWNRRVPDSDLLNPPSNGWHTSGGLYQPKPKKQRDKYGYPKRWPDKEARWMFVYTDEDKNAFFGTPNLSVNGDEWRNRYYRKAFYVPEETVIRIHATADEWFSLHIDGETLLQQENYEVGYVSYWFNDITVAAGYHVLAVNVRGVPSPKVGDGTDAFLCSVWTIEPKVEWNAGQQWQYEVKQTLGSRICKSDGTWQCFYGSDVPGWRRANVLTNFIMEAKQRNNYFANALGIGFTGHHDTYGNAWPERYFNEEVPIGTRGTELCSMLSEGSEFDVWMNPETMVVNAAMKRGSDKSWSIKLEPGLNVTDWSGEYVDEVVNKFLVHYDGGWFNYDVTNSVNAHGPSEGFIELGGVKSEKAARRIITAITKGVAAPQDSAGADEIKKKPQDQPTGSIIPVHGAQPFIDFEVGDIVLAMAEDGSFKKMRVVGLSMEEDENNHLSFDPELEAV